MSVNVSRGDGVGMSMHHERRRGVSAIPLNVREFLSEGQRRVLCQIEGFGWELAFIRRPLFQDPITIIRNSEASVFSVLEEDGTINTDPDVLIRH